MRITSEPRQSAWVAALDGELTANQQWLVERLLKQFASAEELVIRTGKAA